MDRRTYYQAQIRASLYFLSCRDGPSEEVRKPEDRSGSSPSLHVKGESRVEDRGCERRQAAAEGRFEHQEDARPPEEGVARFLRHGPRAAHHSREGIGESRPRLPSPRIRFSTPPYQNTRPLALM